MKKNLLYTICAIIAIVALCVVIISLQSMPPETGQPLNFFNETNKELKSRLLYHNVDMSSHIGISGNSVLTYCNIFSNKTIQDSIDYCTSTEVKNSQNQFLGNLMIAGNIDTPKYIVALVQDDFQNSNLVDTKIIINEMITYLICDCWHKVKPGNFDSVSDWIDEINLLHLQNDPPTSKSQINGFLNKSLLLEITSNDEGYLWKFILYYT